MSDIERIRAEVEDVRRAHFYSGVEHVCDPRDETWGCTALRLAEDKLKLAEALEEVIEGHGSKARSLALLPMIKRVLAEVAGDDATRHEPDPDAGILGHSPEEWERSTRKFEEER